MRKRRNHPAVVSLFAGAGGMAQGFAVAGFEIAFATDNDKGCLETFEANHPGVAIVEADIRSVTASTVADACGLGRGEIDVLIGGPPCRGFSSGNRHNGGKQNPHNELVYEFARLVRELRPRWFVMENVMGLWYMESGRVRSRLISALSETHHVYPAFLNAAAYGVPQTRRRMFLVGSTDQAAGFEFPPAIFGVQPTFQNPRVQPFVAVADAISDLPALGDSRGEDVTKYQGPARTSYQRMMRRGSKILLNHIITRNSSDVIARFRRIKPGGNWSSLSDAMIRKWRSTSIEEVKKASHHNLYRRLDPTKPSPTIGNYRKSMLIHPTEDRGLSAREAARLQSFPDVYVFKGGIGSIQQQIGNATPPLLAEAIAGQIRACLV